MTTKTVAVQLVALTGQYQKSMGAATASTAKLQGTAAATSKGIGSVMGPQIALGAAVAAGAAVKMALDFDNAFTRIGAITNTSQAQVGQWKEQVMALAGETARAPTELADALYFLASAGLDASQIMPALEASAKAAAVGLGETKDIARLTANAMNAYAASGLTAAQVTDTLVAGVREGTAEPDEFADALGRILPVAAKAKVGFDEVVASLSSLSNIGLDVNEGVTAMRGVLLALTATTPKARAQLDDMGITVDELRKSLAEDGLIATLRMLEDATGGNIEKMNAIVGNVRALTGVFGLTGQEAAKVDQVFQNLLESSGSLEGALDKTKDSAGHELRQAFVDLQTAGIELGAALLPVFVALAEGASALASAVGPLVDVFTNAQAAIVRYAGAFNDAVVPGQQLAANANSIRDALSKGTITVDQAHAAITAFGTANVYGADTIAGLHQEVGEVTGGMQRAGMVAGGYTGNLAGVGMAAAGAKEPVEGAGEASGRAGDAMADAEKEADAFADALDRLTGAAFGAEDAAIGWAQAIADMRKELRGGAKTLDLSTQAGRDNRSVLLETAEAAVKVGIAIQEKTGSEAKAVKAVQAHVRELRNEAIAAGFSKAEVDKYIRSLNLTPKQIRTLIKAETRQAQAAVSRFIGDLDRIPDIKDVLIRVRSTGPGSGQQIGHAGGVVGKLPRYHGGGDVKSDEQLILARKGETIRTVAQERALMSALDSAFQGGRSMPTTFNVYVGQEKVDRIVVKALDRAARRVG